MRGAKKLKGFCPNVPQPTEIATPCGERYRSPGRSRSPRGSSIHEELGAGVEEQERTAVGAGSAAVAGSAAAGDLPVVSLGGLGGPEEYQSTITINDDDGYDSEVELIGVCLHGVDLSGALTTQKMLELCQALGRQKILSVKLEDREEQEEAPTEVESEVANQGEAAGFYVLPWHRRTVYVRDIGYSHDSIKCEFNNGLSFASLLPWT